MLSLKRQTACGDDQQAAFVGSGQQPIERSAVSAYRRWQTRPARGKMVSHPSVLLEARRDYNGVRPQERRVDGLTIVTYSRPRVYLDREAWELLPTDGVLLMRVRPTGGEPFALAFTALELEQTFGEVKESKSWETARCYHFPSEPPAARAFLVRQVVDGRADATVQPPLGDQIATRSPAQAISVHPEPVPRSRRTPAFVSAPDEVSADFSEWAAWWYERLGATPEDVAYLAGVAAWRNAWRPARVRGVLIAESHVAQAKGDMRVKVSTDTIGVKNLPSQYVRLVYCLGYGESQICSREPYRNSGTIQYWDILGQVACGEDQPRKASSSFQQRLRWKIGVLRELQRRGIWLQDASPLGVYLGSGARLDPGLQVGLLRDGYRRWVWPSIKNDRPEKLWVIGSGVMEALGGLPGIDPERTITQPQDRLPGRHREGLARMSADLMSLDTDEHA